VVGVLGADGQAIDNVLRLVEVEYSQELEAGHVTIHILDTVAVIVLVHHHHHLKGHVIPKLVQVYMYIYSNFSF
jgi:hypothetical protein